MKGIWTFLSDGMKLLLTWITRKDSEEVRKNDTAIKESDKQDEAEKAVKDKNEENIRDLLS
jgi:hypothetical protein